MKKQTEKMMKKLVCMVMALAVMLGCVYCSPPTTVQAASSSVTIKRFNTMLKEVTGKSAWKKSDSFYKSSAKLTNQIAAVMLERADEQLNGKNYDQNLYEAVVKYKRIKDISKATKKYRKSMRLCFVKGLMPGVSPGLYSGQRNLKPKDLVTASSAKNMVKRLKDKGSRIALTADGQVTRTVSLPSNASEYPYILASFPNTYYQPKLKYQITNYEAGYIPVNLKDYASPKNIMKTELYGPKMSVTYANYGDQWMDMLRKNLELRFNYNYKTTDKAKWKAELLKTFPEPEKEKYSRWIDNYLKWTKDELVVVTADQIAVDPSGMYYAADGLSVRCHVRFKVSSKNYYEADSWDQNTYIFGDRVYIKGLKLNQYYDGVFDINIGVVGMNDDGEHVRVVISDLHAE